jgi:predicted RNA binding protein YcfA (HicA-like mRNA interferase family)
MSKRDKRLAKARENPKNVSVEELTQLLNDFGFVKRQGKGSHTVFQHAQQDNPVVIAAHGQHVPQYIVKQALAAIDQDKDDE